MSPHRGTLPATTLCLVVIVAQLALLLSYFEWPTSQIVRQGFPLNERDILVKDVIPIVAAGYIIGSIAMALTHVVFPKARIMVILYVVGACAGLAMSAFLLLSVAISGSPTIRDLGALAMLFAIPLAIATWAAVVSSWTRSRS